MSPLHLGIYSAHCRRRFVDLAVAECAFPRAVRLGKSQRGCVDVVYADGSPVPFRCAAHVQ